MSDHIEHTISVDSRAHHLVDGAYVLWEYLRLIHSGFPVDTTFDGTQIVDPAFRDLIDHQVELDMTQNMDSVHIGDNGDGVDRFKQGLLDTVIATLMKPDDEYVSIGPFNDATCNACASGTDCILYTKGAGRLFKNNFESEQNKTDKFIAALRDNELFPEGYTIEEGEHVFVVEDGDNVPVQYRILHIQAKHLRYLFARVARYCSKLYVALYGDEGNNRDASDHFKYILGVDLRVAFGDDERQDKDIRDQKIRNDAVRFS